MSNPAATSSRFFYGLALSFVLVCALKPIAHATELVTSEPALPALSEPGAGRSGSVWRWLAVGCLLLVVAAAPLAGDHLAGRGSRTPPGAQDNKPNTELDPPPQRLQSLIAPTAAAASPDLTPEQNRVQLLSARLLALNRSLDDESDSQKLLLARAHLRYGRADTAEQIISQLERYLKQKQAAPGQAFQNLR